MGSYPGRLRHLSTAHKLDPSTHVVNHRAGLARGSQSLDCYWVPCPQQWEWLCRCNPMQQSHRVMSPCDGMHFWSVSSIFLAVACLLTNADRGGPYLLLDGRQRLLRTFLGSCQHVKCVLLHLAVTYTEHLIVLFVHVAGFLGCIITLLVCTKNKNSTSFVFTNFANETGWSSGVGWCVGQLAALFAFFSLDSATHFAEEMPKREVTVPRVSQFAQTSFHI